MKAKCKKCGDTVEVTRPKEFRSCKCGAIGLDYGNEFYYRVNGNPEDFDGEVEDAPKSTMENIVIEPFRPELMTTCHEPVIINRATTIDNFWSEMAEHFKAMAELCEEKSKL